MMSKTMPATSSMYWWHFFSQVCSFEYFFCPALVNKSHSVSSLQVKVPNLSLNRFASSWVNQYGVLPLVGLSRPYLTPRAMIPPLRAPHISPCLPTPAPNPVAILGINLSLIPHHAFAARSTASEHRYPCTA